MVTEQLRVLALVIGFSLFITIIDCSYGLSFVIGSFPQFSPGGGGVLPSNRLMGMCRWMGSHSHDWIDYNGVAFSIGTNRVTRMGWHICGISGVSKFRQVGIWGIFAQK